MASYFWYQRHGGEDAWVQALSEHRQKILDEVKPAFMTVLDAFSSPDDTWGREDYAKMKYLGCLYFDFDAEAIEETIPDFKKFLENLKEMGVNLRSLRLYATGGRGFHIEVPMPVFLPKIHKTGITALPYVYREMSIELVVDTLDMRIYTGRKGRMWRTPGVERSNGKFKVPLSLDEALNMTPELYDEVCSKPVPEPLRDDPELNTTLAALFIKAQQKVDEALKRRAKGNKDEELLARFKGQFPPTMEMIMRGENIAPGTGFHKIALQLAITANALGKSADELVEACEGLCKNHSSDSARYSSPRKRKEELRRMHEYTRDNPCYGYSKGGLRSLVDVDTPTSDLDGLRENAGVGQVPDNDDDDAPLSEEEKEAEAGHASLYEGLMMTKSGIHKRTAEGARTISNISFSKPMLVCDLEVPDRVLAMEAEMRCDGRRIGRHAVPMRAFGSRSSLSSFCSEYGGIFSGSDTQAGVVQLMLNRSARKGERIVYALCREGLDIVQNPLVKDHVERDVVWVHPDEVVTHNSEANYKFVPKLGKEGGFYSDIHLIKEPLPANEKTEAWLDDLLQINSPLTVAQMLGWFVSCFHRQFYHLAFQQFPLLHPNGPAGCGKTQTVLLMGRMFHMATPVLLRSCSSMRPFAITTLSSQSASIPLLLDEYKPSEMGVVKTDTLLQLFRNSYSQAEGSMGGITRGNASGTFRDLTTFSHSAPICFIAEAQEMQTAVVHRTLAVNYSPEDARVHTEHFKRAQAGADYMPYLGALLLRYSWQETVESRREALLPLMEELRGLAASAVNDRQVFNLAVAMAGLNFLDKVLETRFGKRFSDRIDTLRKALWEHKDEINEVVMSEAAKIINDMALISRTEDPDSEFALREGVEYIVKDGYVEVLMRESFVKYFSWCKRKGFTPLFANTDAFIKAMRKFPPTMDGICANSPLKVNGQTRIFRFSLSKLVAEGVEMFKTKS